MPHLCDLYYNQKPNIVFGCGTGRDLQGGSNNVLIGKQAGQRVIDGGSNVFLGHSAGYCNNGTSNIFLGSGTGKSSGTVADNTGGCNVAIGDGAACCLTTGNNNVLFGTHSGEKISTGHNNVFIGCNSGQCHITDGAFSVHIGALTGKYVCGGCNIFLGMYL